MYLYHTLPPSGFSAQSNSTLIFVAWALYWNVSNTSHWLPVENYYQGHYYLVAIWYVHYLNFVLQNHLYISPKWMYWNFECMHNSSLYASLLLAFVLSRRVLLLLFLLFFCMAGRQTCPSILFSSCTGHMSCCVQAMYCILFMPTVFCFMDPNYKSCISRNQVYNLFNN